MEAPPFRRFGPDAPLSPVVVSVPHAGRTYPPGMAALVSVPLARLTMLEDRCVDALAHAAVTTETLLIARTPRGWIDLNRSPATDRDPQVDADAPPTGSDKVRSGIGLIPRRAGGADNMWRRKLTGGEVADRIARVHAPYHAALAQALAAAHARFGVAMLVDLHSMPPLAGFDPPHIVLGDRFGRSGPGAFTARAAAIVRAHGLTVAVNHPYAGGHILATHARPRQGVHGLQVEIDRSLYLDATLDQPGPGLPRIAAMVRAMLDALTEAVLAGPLPIAAE
jgi:N-formylglutamate amidohydrolase